MSRIFLSELVFKLESFIPLFKSGYEKTRLMLDYAVERYSMKTLLQNLEMVLIWIAMIMDMVSVSKQNSFIITIVY